MHTEQYFLEDENVGKRFTAYLELSVKRYKRTFRERQIKSNLVLCSLEVNNVESSFDIEKEVFSEIPGWLTLENEELQDQLMKLSKRKLCIFWNHVVENESLAQIARDLELPYDTVTSIYYRTIKKIKEGMIKNGYEL